MQASDHREGVAEETQTNHSLILRLHDWKDHRSWDEFYRTYHKLIFSVARQANLSDAEAWEVVQNTFLTIAKQSRKGSAYNPEQGSFKSWLLQVTRWRIKDLQRKRQRADTTLHQQENEEAIPLDDLPDLRDTNVNELWEREWQKNITRAAVARVKLKVSPRQFQIFDFHVLQGMEVAEVCRQLGVSAARVYLAKHRVSTLLRREIAELRAQEH